MHLCLLKKRFCTTACFHWFAGGLQMRNDQEKHRRRPGEFSTCEEVVLNNAAPLADFASACILANFVQNDLVLILKCDYILRLGLRIFISLCCSTLLCLISSLNIVFLPWTKLARHMWATFQALHCVQILQRSKSLSVLQSWPDAGKC